MDRFLGLDCRSIAGEFAAFVGDPQVLALSLQAVERDWLEAEPEPARRQFRLIPLMHSEEMAVQEVALLLSKC